MSYYYYRDRQIDWWNQKESLEINSNIQWFDFDKGINAFHRTEDNLIKKKKLFREIEPIGYV